MCPGKISHNNSQLRYGKQLNRLSFLTRIYVQRLQSELIFWFSAENNTSHYPALHLDLEVLN